MRLVDLGMILLEAVVVPIGDTVILDVAPIATLGDIVLLDVVPIAILGDTVLLDVVPIATLGAPVLLDWFCRLSCSFNILVNKCSDRSIEV